MNLDYFVFYILIVCDQSFEFILEQQNKDYNKHDNLQNDSKQSVRVLFNFLITDR